MGGDGTLLARVRAAPVDGAANAALIGLLAEAPALPRRRVSLERGLTGRVKRVRFDDVDAGAVRAAWPGVTVDGG